MEIVKCSLADCTKLAVLNKQLIEDEGHDNPMDVLQLEQRMLQFLSNDYSAYYFMENDRVIGYGLVQESVQPLYLRHFFICRDCRRRGFGRRAFHALLAVLGVDTIELDVLDSNERGKAFWQSLQFQPRLIRLRYQKGKQNQ